MFVKNQFDDILSIMDERIYTKDEFFDLVFRLHPNFAPASCQWALGVLTQEKKIFGLGYGYYKRLTKPFNKLESWKPSKKLLDVTKSITRAKPFCIYSIEALASALRIEEFRKATVLETPKDLTFPLYYELHNSNSRRAMLSPSNRDLEMYFEDGGIVIKKLFSKAPCQSNGSITIEKLIVDLLCDSFLNFAFPTEDLTSKVSYLISRYDFKVSTVMNYAKRRKVDGLVYQLIQENLPVETFEKLSDYIK